MRTHYITYFRMATAFLFLIAVGLVSCIKEDFEMPGAQDESGIRLSITLPDPITINSTESRAGVADFNVISDLNVVVAIGYNIQKVYYFSGFAESSVDNATLKPTGEKTAEIDIQDIYPGTADVYLVANQGDAITVRTVQELNKIVQEGAIPIGCKMYAKADNSTIVNGIRQLSASLKRTVAMITVVLEDGGLAEGVEIRPRTISLHNVPTQCMIGEDNRASEGNIEPAGESKSILTWQTLGAMGTEGKIITVGSHNRDAADDPYFDPLFMYENLQGTIVNTDEKLKDPSKLGKENENYASYVQIDADYASREKNVYGTVSFKFCLGEDISSDFNVKRNTHYQITLGLKDYVVTEGGQINPDGTLKTNESDKTWRVDTQLDEISFTANTNVVNQSGAFVFLTVEGGGDKSWWLKSSSSSSDQGVHMWDSNLKQWMAVQNGIAISSTKDAIPIFVEGIDPEVDWIPGANEVITYTIELYDKDPGGRKVDPVKTLTITRYPFKKVEFSSIPYEKQQVFYLDAVDREPLPWGYEDVIFSDSNNPTSNGLQGFTITKMLIENYEKESLRYMPYGTSFGDGSAMMAASFLDLYPNGNGTGNYLPSWSPDNAPQELPDVSNTNTKRKFFYTIPSIAQWQAIENQMGDLKIAPGMDENCSLKRYVQYWTSNHATTGFNPEYGKLYSYTYEIERGYNTIKQGEPYYSYALRTKKLPYRCIAVRNPWWKQ